MASQVKLYYRNVTAEVIGAEHGISAEQLKGLAEKTCPLIAELNQQRKTGQTIPRFAAGQLVHHNSFGLGTVKEFIDMGENSVVVVKFNTGQTKTLMLKYAGLSKINNI